VKEWVDDCQKELEQYRSRGIGVLQSGRFDEDEHYYLDTESIFGFVYEIGNNGRSARLSDVSANKVASAIHQFFHCPSVKQQLKRTS